MIWIIGFVSKLWWILLDIGIVALVSILYRGDRKTELQKARDFITE